MSNRVQLEPVYDSSEEEENYKFNDHSDTYTIDSFEQEQMEARGSSRAPMEPLDSVSTSSVIEHQHSSAQEHHQQGLPHIGHPRHGKTDPFNRQPRVSNDPFADFGRESSSGTKGSEISTDFYPTQVQAQLQASQQPSPQPRRLSDPPPTGLDRPPPTDRWFSGFGRMLNSSVERLSSVVFGEQPSEIANAAPTQRSMILTDPKASDPYQQFGDTYNEDEESDDGGVRRMPPSSTAGNRERYPAPKQQDHSREQINGSPHGRSLSTEVVDEHGFPTQSVTQIQFNVVAAIRQYRRNPVDALFSLVRTALTARSMANPIIGVELAECRGDNNLVSLVIQSIKLDYEDEGVQDELSIAVDNVLRLQVSDRIAPESCELLKVFFSPLSVRLTREQHDLVKRSGFEFVMLLDQFPHVLEDLPKPKACRSQAFWRQISQALEPFFIIVSLMIIYGDLSITCLYLSNWFNDEDMTAFQISLVVIAGGTFLSVIANKVVNSTREDDLAFYTKELSDFPTVYLRVVPILPLLETYTAFGALREICCHRKSLVMRRELAAMFTNAALIHSMFYSTQQILTQSYFVYWRSDLVDPVDSRFSTEYLLLIISTSLSIFVHPLLYLRSIVTNDSVNSMGFCFFGSKMPDTEEGQVSKFARVLSLLLVYLLQFNVFMLLVAIDNISDCSNLMITWMVIAGVSILITIVMFIYTMIYTKDFFKSSRWLVIPIILQLGYNVFISVYASDQDRTDAGCRLFFAIGAVNIVFGYIGWGLLVVVVAAWAIYTAYVKYQVKKLRRESLGEASQEQNEARRDEQLQSQPFGEP